jgi:ribonuclease-3
MRLKIIKDGVGLSTSAKKSTSQTSSSVHSQPAPVQPHVQQPLGPEHYGEIEELLGYTFKDRNWLERALTHRSVQVNGIKNDYERLEFLGDAVFDLAVAHLLLDKHEQAHEGELSKMRAALVNTASLAEVARRLSLGKFIKLSRGELASGAHERPSILADVVEAVLGAVYREGGFAVACDCVARLLGDSVTTVTPRDPKTELQEALHATGSEAPVYRLECVEGPEHSPNFISVVEVDGQIVGRGRGTTKKASQQAAAEEALGLLKPKDDLDQRFIASPAAAAMTSSGESVRDNATQTDSTETNHDA